MYVYEEIMKYPHSAQRIMAQGQATRFVSLSKRHTNMDHKVPYVDVISDAIMSSAYRRLTSKEIFQYVSVKYGPMKKEQTLRNTIRHTLSRHNVFRKVQRGRQKKPNWWTVDEEVLAGLYDHADTDADTPHYLPTSIPLNFYPGEAQYGHNSATVPTNPEPVIVPEYNWWSDHQRLITDTGYGNNTTGGSIGLPTQSVVTIE